MPEGSRIIRMSRVDDSQYNGDFVWAIVNVGDECIAQDIDYKPQGDIDGVELLSSTTSNTALAIKEKQTVSCWGNPVGAACYGDLPYVFCDGSYKDHEAVGGKGAKSFQLAFYKTGQEIDLPISKLEYLGVCKLQIVQELALYVFLVK